MRQNDHTDDDFRRKWERLPEETRNRIDAEIENYTDEDDFKRRYPREPANDTAEPRPDEPQPELPDTEPDAVPQPAYDDDETDPPPKMAHFLTEIHAHVESLFRDPNMRENPSYARNRIKSFAKYTELLLEGSFNLAHDHRPIRNSDRDRLWSQRHYQGMSFGKIAKDFQHELPAKGSYLEVARAVKRHRERREGLMWKLRKDILAWERWQKFWRKSASKS